MMTRLFPRNLLSYTACFVGLAFLCVTFSGCASDSSVGKGAAGGAFLGAIAGALLNPSDPLKGAVVGAAAGAVVGAIAGWAWDYNSRQSKDYAQTQQETAYNPGEGERVAVTKYSLNPVQVEPGNPITLNSQYYVMVPQQDADIKISEVRYVKRYDASSKSFEELGRENTTVTVKPGTRDGSGKITLPKDAEPGVYRLGFGVAYKDKKDEREIPVTVTRVQGKLQVHIAALAGR
jgi:hypothetical protein